MKVALACLLGLEQPRVLDGDHGLVSEGLQKMDLVSRKGLYDLAPDENYAKRLTAAEQRRCEGRPVMSLLLMNFCVGVLCLQLSSKILDMDRSSLQKGSARDCPSCQCRAMPPSSDAC